MDPKRQLSVLFKIRQKIGKSAEIVKAHLLDGRHASAVHQLHIRTEFRKNIVPVRKHRVARSSILRIDPLLLRRPSRKETVYVGKTGQDRSVTEIRDLRVGADQRCRDLSGSAGEDAFPSYRHVSRKGHVPLGGKNALGYQYKIRSHNSFSLPLFSRVFCV